MRTVQEVQQWWSKLATRVNSLLWLVPVAILGVGGSMRAWTSDDGLINLRIVRQIQAGRGPVFNAFERVEAGTSALWLWLLTVGDWVLPMRLEYVAAVLGIVASCLAVAIVGRSSMRRRPNRVVVPIGVLAYACLSPAWDFASSGLETGISLLYIALVYTALDREEVGRDGWWALMLGVGPLIRPDLAIYAAIGVLALVWRTTSVGQGLRRVAVALALPCAYQIFRMGFYATIVPNTALAKSAGNSRWGQGLRYFHDTFGTYLILPLLGMLVAAIAAPEWKMRYTTREWFMRYAIAFGGAVHIAYVVYIGGGFMHARLLLPGIFSLLAPFALVPRRRSIGYVVLVGLWAVTAIVALRSNLPEFPGRESHIVDERAFYAEAIGGRRPLTLDDYTTPNGRIDQWRDSERLLRQLARTQASGVVFTSGDGEAVFLPRDAGTFTHAMVPDLYMIIGNIGVVGNVAGIDVPVLDLYGLADPIVARTVPEVRGRPGHERKGAVWLLARVPVGEGLEDFDIPNWSEYVRILECPKVVALQEALSEPMSPSRFLRNIVSAWGWSRIRLPESPDPNTPCP